VYSQSFNPCRQSRSADAEMLPTAHYSLSTFCRLSPLSTAFTPNRPLTPLSTAFTQTHRGVGCLPGSSAASQLFTSHGPAPNPVGVTNHKSRLFILLRALCRSCRSFCNSDPLFSRACTLFCQNTRGMGILEDSAGHRGWGYRRSRPLDVPTFRRYGEEVRRRKPEKRVPSDKVGICDRFARDDKFFGGASKFKGARG
jgi:hypothetical protein